MLAKSDLKAIGDIIELKLDERFALQDEKIGARFAAQDAKIADLHDLVTGQESKIESIATALFDIHERLDGIEGRLGNVEDRVDAAALDMAEVKSRLGRMEFRIEGIATIVEHSHETRILALESRAAAG